ncbi:vacuolar protein sorting-associated protein 26-domain-containing protein [Zychaea mexicana]|uniref:vacuolar protein sorting-associated protein 26-domain-containing protein n=1 Tax=Zychaea mexicana TaxID=64656 RepID=UPI0022FDD954|nr:vacuolar protein sorting-associated protein 26-domain-containing protein [Zychaea mexicana]KAI9496295.1 vacuolar protein sorting-associated protein 26-domain-containing protein [Zychaea mexicana]
MSVASLFGFSAPADIKIHLTDTEQRKGFDMAVNRSQPRERLQLYFDREPVKGEVKIKVGHGKRLEHSGIRVECVGSIVVFNDSSQSKEFLCLSQELAAPGEALKPTMEFKFSNVEKQYECYYGINVQLRYFVRVIVARRMGNLVQEADILVRSYHQPKEVIAHSIKMEVGIEDCLHIEFEYNKSTYHLKDVIVGKIFFLLVRIKIKHMELCIVRRETTGFAPNTYNESETVSKFEIMDGAPVRGEVIPIRLFLGGYNLTPTFRDINKRFSVRYYLNLVLYDEENRRYYKQQEITLYRRPEDDGLPQEVAERDGDAD